MTRSYKSIRSGGTLSAGMSDRLTWLNFDFLVKTYELNWYTFERKKWYTLQWKHWYTMHRNIQHHGIWIAFPLTKHSESIVDCCVEEV